MTAPHGYLALEDGTVLRGRSVGADGVAFGEAVFTTGMSGYQETVSDPSFAGQLVCFTAPMIGNYGVAEARMESARPHARAVLMRRLGGEEWAAWLHGQGVVALDEIDTRALTLRLRADGSMRAVAVADVRALTPEDAVEQVRRQPPMEGSALVADVSSDAPFVAHDQGRVRVALVDYGAKRSIVRRLAAAGAAVTVFPHVCDADELAAFDGVLLSNGPGDPEPLVAEVAVVRDVLGRVPVLGICLGHQLLGLATGLGTFKLPFGHRGANHPVLDRAGGRVLVTSQNHGFAVVPTEGREATYVSLYDGTVEGLEYPELRARSVQFHPEAGPGTHDAWPILEGWVRELRGGGLMGARRDIESVLLIGSGPIVIGQACEFDYAGCQALKVLREDGYRTIVVNSNPATIMTDPGFADRTYIEPLDLEGVTDVLERERPDALLPTLGGQTALNLAVELSEAGVLARLGVELIGASLDVIRVRRTGSSSARRCRAAACTCPHSRIVTSVDDLEGVGVPCVVRPAFTLGGHGGGFADDHAALERQVERGLAESPITQVPGRGVGARLGRVRARSDSRSARQRGRGVLDRESRPDGSTHGRLRHGGAADDAPGRGVPGASRRRRRRDPRGRRRDGRLQHSVRAASRDRRRARDRDESACVPLVGARLEGDRLSDRKGGREARDGLHARRDPK